MCINYVNLVKHSICDGVFLVKFGNEGVVCSYTESIKSDIVYVIYAMKYGRVCVWIHIQL